MAASTWRAGHLGRPIDFSHLRPQLDWLQTRNLLYMLCVEMINETLVVVRLLRARAAYNIRALQVVIVALAIS